MIQIWNSSILDSINSFKPSFQNLARDLMDHHNHLVNSLKMVFGSHFVKIHRSCNGSNAGFLHHWNVIINNIWWLQDQHLRKWWSQTFQYFCIFSKRGKPKYLECTQTQIGEQWFNTLSQRIYILACLVCYERNNLTLIWSSLPKNWKCKWNQSKRMIKEEYQHWSLAHGAELNLKTKFFLFWYLFLKLTYSLFSNENCQWMVKYMLLGLSLFHFCHETTHLSNQLSCCKKRKTNFTDG